MNDTKTPMNSARPLRRSRSDIISRLRARDSKPDLELELVPVPGHGEEDADRYLANAGTEPACSEDEALDVDLESTIAWLDGLCKEEQARAIGLLNTETESKRENTVVEFLVLRAQDLAPDTTILDRIKKGETASEKVYEDLLAPLRLKELPPGSEESYEDMVSVLLAWNKHVAGDSGDDLDARQQFIAALEGRLKAVDKVLAIVRDSLNPDQCNKVGQRGILEPSYRQLLKAIHAYRPETRAFKSQNPFDLLVMMWAHIGRASPDIEGDSELMYLTYRTLHAEIELTNRFFYEKKRREYQGKKELAIAEGKQDEVVRLTKRWDAYNQKVAGTARQRIVAQFCRSRRELSKTELNEVLDLTLLQSAQKCAEGYMRNANSSPPWKELLDKCNRCADADGNLDEKLEPCLAELKATSEIVSNQIRGMSAIHDTVFTRALKFTGEDLHGMDSAMKERVIQARLDDPVTARMMSETVHGVRESQQVATRLLRHVEEMDRSLCVMMKVAENQHDEYDNLLRFLESNQSLSIRDSVDEQRPSSEMLLKDNGKIAPGKVGIQT